MKWVNLIEERVHWYALVKMEIKQIISIKGVFLGQLMTAGL